jgi:hypothetical protein
VEVRERFVRRFVRVLRGEEVRESVEVREEVRESVEVILPARGGS